MPSPTLFPDTPEPAPGGYRGYARVSVERGGNAGTTALTYGLPDISFRPGQRVTVPLGRGNSRAEGVIVEVGGPELIAGISASRIKRVIAAAGDPLPDELIRLAEWVSRYYACPLGVVLGAMVPGAVKTQTGASIETLLQPADDATPGVPPPDRKLSPTATDAWSKIGSIPMPATARSIADAIGHASVAAVNRLVRAGLLTEDERPVVRERGAFTERMKLVTAQERPPEPTDEQRHAIETIGGDLDRHAVTLLQGITGSGKTEVYLRVIDRVLALGRSAIVLVPEISLTPQAATRFVSRFGSRSVAVLHSGLSRSERYGQWRRAATGEARVIVGARSAVFAPAPDLGLIVVDEEHDASYKQDRAPRYQARDVAIMRARLADRPVLLGSATPSLEAFASARDGRLQRLRLTTRPAGARLPRVEIVDLREERRRDPETARRMRAIGPRLAYEMTRTLAAGSQVVLLVNRRGFARYLTCPDPACGWTLGCDRCSVRLVTHRDASIARGQFARCHHCHAESLRPDRCPDCGKRLVGLGIGTQRVEQELAERFAAADLGDGRRGLVLGGTFDRVDTDTVRRGRAFFETLDRFERGETRVLLGTQMIAKGLDFPGVRLVGIVDADTSLALPDFRASERTFQLVSQVAGRAGRRDAEGLVLVQTMDPTSDPIVHAAAHDYDAFAEEELALRESCDLPPRWRMVRIVSRDADPDRAKAANQAMADRAAAHAGDALRVVGPAECVIARINEQHRFATEITAADPRHLQAVVRALVADGSVLSDSKTAIDVDPVSLL
ncbi:MAG: primosomal protein N' [Planctomycetota bacterium]